MCKNGMNNFRGTGESVILPPTLCDCVLHFLSLVFAQTRFLSPSHIFDFEAWWLEYDYTDDVDVCST